MRTSRSRAHFAEALRWSAEPLGPWQAVAAGIGMAGPVAFGFATGAPDAGFAAAVGGLMVGALPPEKGAIEQLKDLALAFAPAAAAILATVLVGAPGPREQAIVVVLAAIASIVGGFSRTMVVATYRFVLFVLIMVSVAGSVPNRATLLLPLALGFAWTGAANLVLGALGRALRRGPPAEPPELPPAIPFAKRRAHWRRGLAHLAGWQYTLRLSACLAVAFLLANVWPEHHLHWIAVTVVLVTERTLDPLPVKTTQRAVGTLLGVLIAAALGGWGSPYALIAAIAILATARAALRMKNYLLYTTVTTPLILAVLDAGAPPDRGLLVDRLAATLAAGVLVLLANAVMRSGLRDAAPLRP